MPTFTANYGLIRPNVNDPTDENLWGGYLNTSLDMIDEIMKDNEDAIENIKPYDFIPIATIQKGLWNTAPEGYLPLQGGTYNRSDYQELYDHLDSIGLVKPQSIKELWEFGNGNGSTTFTMADWRNMFDRNISASRVLGTYQGDAIRNITGKWYTTGDRFTGNESNYFEGAMYQERRHNTWQYSGQGMGNRLTGVGFDASRVVPTADENRPVNIALMWVIKHKPSVTA